MKDVMKRVIKILCYAVVDPGYPGGGGANPKVGCDILSFGNISVEKLHENERIWTAWSLATRIRHCCVTYQY